MYWILNRNIEDHNANINVQHHVFQQSIIMIFSQQNYYSEHRHLFSIGQRTREKIIIFTLKDNFYTKFIYNPKMTLFDLIIKVANVFSLYNGFNFVMINELVYSLFSEKFIRIKRKFINTKTIKIVKVGSINIRKFTYLANSIHREQ